MTVWSFTIPAYTQDWMFCDKHMQENYLQTRHQRLLAHRISKFTRFSFRLLLQTHPMYSNVVIPRTKHQQEYLASHTGKPKISRLEHLCQAHESNMWHPPQPMSLTTLTGFAGTPNDSGSFLLLGCVVLPMGVFGLGFCPSCLSFLSMPLTLDWGVLFAVGVSGVLDREAASGVLGGSRLGLAWSSLVWSSDEVGAQLPGTPAAARTVDIMSCKPANASASVFSTTWIWIIKKGQVSFNHHNSQSVETQWVPWKKRSTKEIKEMKIIRMIFLVKHYIQKWSNIAKNLPAKGPPHRGHWYPCNDISLSSPALGPSLQKDHWASSLQNDKMMLTTRSTPKKASSYFRSTRG